MVSVTFRSESRLGFDMLKSMLVEMLVAAGRSDLLRISCDWIAASSAQVLVHVYFGTTPNRMFGPAAWHAMNSFGKHSVSTLS